jgi:hypothetical protein
MQHAFDVRDRPFPHRSNFFDRRHEIPVVVEVADDRLADLADLLPEIPQLLVLGLQ